MTKLPRSDRKRLDRTTSYGIRDFATRTADDKRRISGSILFDCVDDGLCWNWAAELPRDNLHRLAPREAFTWINV